ncbi:MAG: ABC transporter [Spirochaetaceae bacterium 4572_59]|nr:MAG: ABC transporter [Spirochaetaceae bacterium 4572_59]
MMNYMTLANLTKKYSRGKGDEIHALDSFNLTVKKGEFVTILGPSGCGKTTALRIIAGFEEQTEGDVFLKGENINHVAPYKRFMPMVFQSYALFPHMNVYENIAYGLRALKKSRDIIRNDVAMACQVVNLVGLEKCYPGELSGGQQQRVALARTLVLKPEMILFDEPLSNLDVKLRIQTRTEIKRVHRMLGITVLYVTHDQSEALSMSDRIVIMNHGRTVQEGTPEEIYNNPINSFVADFIGNANFISAEVEEIEGKRVTIRLQNRIIVVKQENPELSFSEGEEVYLAIKPEATGISSDKADFTGIVDTRSFQGSHTEYKIEFEGSFINIHQSNMGKEIQTYQAGDIINLKFDKDLFHLYKK